MQQSELGLPPEYQEIPEYFDAHNIGDDTAEKNSIIESLLKQNQVKRVLDMTCGTGSQVFFLKERGYEVIGSDFSPALLDAAREKAKNLDIDVTFIDGDMRTIQLGHFDAVITIFNAIGHLTKDEFNTAVRNINDNLKPGGVYIFDIFNVNALNKSAIQDLSYMMEKQLGDAKLHQSQFSTLDKENGLLTSYNNYSTQIGTDKPNHFQSKFTLKIYSRQELNGILSSNGFEIITQLGMMAEEFKEEETLNILTVARKCDV